MIQSPHCPVSVTCYLLGEPHEDKRWRHRQDFAHPVGLGLIAWALMGGPVWAWIGILPLLTGAMGWCPAYTLLGMNTCPLKKK